MLRHIFAFWTVALTLAAGAGQPIKVVLVGDSTVNDEGGWGPGFRASFGPGVQVVNLALNGRSSKSFRDEGAWAKVLQEKPDFVLIQFGHNDQPGKGPERETDPATTYRANMERFVEEVRAAGATPVLVTSIVRRVFDAEGKFQPDALAGYAEEVRRLAVERQAPLIDLYTLTRQQTERLGPAGSLALGRNDAQGKPDRTHLGPKGQTEIGAMAAKELARAAPRVGASLHELVSWRDAMRQPAAWYGGDEAVRIAGNLLLYQREIGGWDKNIDMALALGPTDRAAIEKQKGDAEAHSTIDNDATYTEMRYLARVHTATQDPRFQAAFRRGLEYLLKAQYPNGGWPQFYPLRNGYWSHITYNDDAMAGVLELLREVADRNPEFAFLGDGERARARQAIDKGVACILKTQVVQDGKLTVWCAQHDEHTLAPAKGRAYELPSLSGSESVGVVQFLMGIARPSPEVVRAIEGAVAWFRANQIKGIRVTPVPAPGTPKGFDNTVIADPAAPPLWARFYELGTNRPIFCGRDSVVKYSMAEIEYERRNGYRWYVDRPSRLIDVDYPEWLRKLPK
ncbi:MAG: pectate lyase [Candidatus Solibacter sp.]|jgi:PelA/Pel-15E family pectate lyase